MGLREDIMAFGHHQASCLSCLDIMQTIFKVRTEHFKFVLSKAHASPVLYYLLAQDGTMKREDILNYPGHCEYGMPGIHFTGGSLGMGLGVACGLALPCDSVVGCLVGDGELYEGSCWEAIMFASAHHLKNLILFVDRNGMSASDFTENFLPLDPLMDKFKAFGWNKPGQPLVYIVNTIKGKGVKEFEGNPRCHTMRV